MEERSSGTRAIDIYQSVIVLKEATDPCTCFITDTKSFLQQDSFGHYKNLVILVFKFFAARGANVQTSHLKLEYYSKATLLSGYCQWQLNMVGGLVQVRQRATT